MEKINRISASSTAMAGMMGAQKVLQLAQEMYSAISDRSEHLSKLAHTFSPEAMTSAANLSQAQLQSDMAVGQAMGPAQAGIDRAKQDAIAEETANTLKNAQQIGEGMIVLNAIWNQTKLLATESADATLMALGSLNQMPEMAAAAAANPVETAVGSTFGVSAGPLLQAIGSTLEAMFAKVKGD
jgi:Holliday junction resolvasome RuvABC endonuclease subunit